MKFPFMKQKKNLKWKKLFWGEVNKSKLVFGGQV